MKESKNPVQLWVVSLMHQQKISEFNLTQDKIFLKRYISPLQRSSRNAVSMRDSPKNRPRSIYQYSNMAPRLSGQTSIFGVVFFVSKSLLGIEGQKKLEKFAIFTRKPRSHAWILIYRTWPIASMPLYPMKTVLWRVMQSFLRRKRDEANILL